MRCLIRFRSNTCTSYKRQIIPTFTIVTQNMYKSVWISRLTAVVEQRKILKRLHTLPITKNDLQIYMAALHTEDVISVVASHWNRRIRLEELWRRKFTEYQAMIECLLPFLSQTWPFKKFHFQRNVLFNFSQEEKSFFFSPTVAINIQQILQVKKTTTKK